MCLYLNKGLVDEKIQINNNRTFEKYNQFNIDFSLVAWP